MSKRRRFNAPAAKTPARRFYRRPDQLTGGTRDVNPQYMHATVTMSGANTVTTKEINMPIIRLPRARMTQVVEILKVFFQHSDPPASGAPTLSVEETLQLITTDSTTVKTFDDPTLVAMSQYKNPGTTAIGQHAILMPHCIDLTDSSGHGILVGSDKLYLLIDGTTWGTTTGYCKILYRLKAVSVSEYIGIVQSQT